jgi:hypothetical protein
MSCVRRPADQVAWRAQGAAIAQNRCRADTSRNAGRYPHRQQNPQTTVVLNVGRRPALFASARPVSPRAFAQRCQPTG